MACNKTFYTPLHNVSKSQMNSIAILTEIFPVRNAFKLDVGGATEEKKEEQVSLVAEPSYWEQH